MIRFALALVATLLLAPVAEAGTWRLGQPPIAQITIPDSWKPTETDHGIEALAPDESIYISVEVKALGDGSKLGEAMLEAVAWVEEQGAKLTKKSDAQDATVNGYPAIAAEASGTDADGAPTHVEVVGVIVNQTTGLVLLGWSDPGKTRHAKAFRGIAESLKLLN